MESARQNAKPDSASIAFSVPGSALADLPLPLIVVGEGPDCLWRNYAAELLCPAPRLAEVLRQAAVQAGLNAALAGGALGGFDDRDGALCLRALSLIDADKLLVAIDDLGRRDRLEEEYRRLQKSGSLFLFSQGLGHDLKDRLTGVVGNLNLARLLLEEGRGGPDCLERIRDAERAALEADGLVQQFMQFSHNDLEVRQALDVAQLVGSAAQIGLGGARRIQVSQRETAWKAMGNPGQVQQLFQNILANAAEASPDGSTIHIELENLRIVAGAEPVSPPAGGGQIDPGDYLAVHVRDTGEGILARDLPHVFEPFFSRKELRQGLGLTVALSIARKHGGHIDIRSLPGRGTTVSVYLPVAEPGGAEAGAGPSRPAKILVMDDESLVREVWERMLPRLGHRGSYAAEGAEALYLYQTALKSDYPFDLVILDLTVPGGLGAAETLASLRQADPAVKAVICSGYTQDPLMQSYREYGFAAALPKPFNVDAIRRLIQETLG